MNDEDDRLTKALAHANYKTTIVQQRENLKLRYTNALLHAQNGGIFTVNPNLLAMVDLLVRTKQTEAVLIDDKAIPSRSSIWRRSSTTSCRSMRKPATITLWLGRNCARSGMSSGRSMHDSRCPAPRA